MEGWDQTEFDGGRVEIGLDEEGLAKDFAGGWVEQGKEEVGSEELGREGGGCCSEDDILASLGIALSRPKKCL